MTGFKSKKTAALDEDGMYLVHPLVFSDFVPPQPAQEPQRPWVDLTRTQIQNVYFVVLEEHRGVPQMQGQLAFGEALQAAIKEKNT